MLYQIRQLGPIMHQRIGPYNTTQLSGDFCDSDLASENRRMMTMEEGNEQTIGMLDGCIWIIGSIAVYISLC